MYAEYQSWGSLLKRQGMDFKTIIKRYLVFLELHHLVTKTIHNFRVAYIYYRRYEEDDKVSGHM